jgi:DNA-binding transcriptional LysR family regulator
MELHYLRTFYEVAKEKSFTRAAINLQCTQANASIHVKKLEENLQQKLFIRKGTIIELTSFGESLFGIWKNIFEKINQAEKETKNILITTQITISFGVTPEIGATILPSILKSFTQIEPKVLFEVFVLDTPELVAYLNDEKIELAILENIPIDNEKFEKLEVRKSPFVLVGNDLSLPLIIDTNITSTKLIQLLEVEHNIKFLDKIYVNGSISIIKEMLKLKEGNALLPYYSISKEIEMGELKILYQMEEKKKYQIILNKDKKNSLHLINLIGQIQKIF